MSGSGKALGAGGPLPGMAWPAGLAALLRRTLREWVDDHCARLAAALAYYTVFAMAPLLVVALAVAGLAFDQPAARSALVGEMRSLVGSDGAVLLEEALANAARGGHGALATAVGTVVLLVGASGAFAELQGSLNAIWGVRAPRGKALARLLRERVLSFSLVLVLGFLLLASLLVSAALAALAQRLGGGLLGAAEVLFRLANGLVSLALFTLLIAAIYRVLPDAQVAWRDVWAGAALTAVLLTVGKALIGLYLGRGTLGSAYGAAGALAVLLAWAYYVGLIFFLGAEFTQVLADSRGELVPRRGAVRVETRAVEPAA
jgi:membrane protein